jgi:predicted nucleic acid-binding protein
LTFFVDTNVLLYAVDRGAEAKREIAHDILVRGRFGGLCLGSQVLGEFLNVIRRKQTAVMPRAAALVEQWALIYPVIATGPEHMLAGARLAERYRLQFWDSVILAVAIDAGGEALLSEDMQDGAVIEGVTILDPFAPANLPAIHRMIET